MSYLKSFTPRWRKPAACAQFIIQNTPAGASLQLVPTLCATPFGKLSEFAKVFYTPIHNSKFTIQNSQPSLAQACSLCPHPALHPLANFQSLPKFFIRHIHFAPAQGCSLCPIQNSKFIIPPTSIVKSLQR